jgi:hypothetical protein
MLSSAFRADDGVTQQAGAGIMWPNLSHGARCFWAETDREEDLLELRRIE